MRVADGGTNDVENLVIACRGCNQRRGKEAEGREFQTNWFFGSKSNEHGLWQQCLHCQTKESRRFRERVRETIKKIKELLKRTKKGDFSLSATDEEFDAFAGRSGASS
ncbi:MAG: HNH endonuclease [Pyrinomonadaceae bacterium]